MNSRPEGDPVTNHASSPLVPPANPVSRLAEGQQALLAALLAHGRAAPDTVARFITGHATATTARGFNAYQSNAHLLAERSLQSVYPVLAQLLGPESFAAFARAFWHAHPPVRGDLAQWGDALPGFIEASESLADEPYLGDVARLEWALHTAASQADAAADLASLQRLVDQDPTELRLRLAPGLVVWASRWPVVSIVLAHQPPAQEEHLAQAGQRLREGVTETVLVWREGLKPRCREALPGEGEFLPPLQQGQPLGLALDGALAAGFDFNHWLPLAVSTGLLLAVEPLAAPA